MRRFWRTAGLAALSLVVVAALGTGAASARRVARAAKLTIHGPTHNAYHVYFNEVVTGTAGGKGNYVVSGEQLG